MGLVGVCVYYVWLFRGYIELTQNQKARDTHTHTKKWEANVRTRTSNYWDVHRLQFETDACEYKFRNSVLLIIVGISISLTFFAQPNVAIVFHAALLDFSIFFHILFSIKANLKIITVILPVTVFPIVSLRVALFFYLFLMLRGESEKES